MSFATEGTKGGYTAIDPPKTLPQKYPGDAALANIFQSQAHSPSGSSGALPMLPKPVSSPGSLPNIYAPPAQPIYTPVSHSGQNRSSHSSGNPEHGAQPEERGWDNWRKARMVGLAVGFTALGRAGIDIANAVAQRENFTVPYVPEIAGGFIGAAPGFAAAIAGLCVAAQGAGDCGGGPNISCSGPIEDPSKSKIVGDALWRAPFASLPAVAMGSYAVHLLHSSMATTLEQKAKDTAATYLTPASIQAIARWAPLGVGPGVGALTAAGLVGAGLAARAGYNWYTKKSEAASHSREEYELLET